MGRTLPILFALASPCCALAQYDAKAPLKPEDILLARVRYVMALNISRQPDYTCTETIERSLRAAGSKRFQLEDTVRLEVAFTGGRELYAWPGSSRFDEREVTEIVSGGAIGSGDFALHAKSVYVSTGARISYVGEDLLEGRKTQKFHFVMPRLFSGYHMKISGREGVVGYQGDLWHDPESLDLVRLQLVVDDIPPDLPLSKGEVRIDYERTQIGGGDFLLPKSSELTLTSPNGSESRNHTAFDRCRQYSGESTLTFEDPPPQQAPERPAMTVTLPAGLEFDLALSAPVKLGTAAVGDVVNASVTKDAKQRNQVWLPRGTKVELRIRRLWPRASPLNSFAVQMEPFRFSSSNTEGVLRGELVVPAPERRNIIIIRSGPPTLPSGFRMTWRTLDSAGAKP